MSGYLVTSNIVTTETVIREDDLRTRLAREFMDQIGALGPDGMPRPGVRYSVTRGDGRNNGYVIRVTRDLSKDTAPKLTDGGK